MGISNFPSWLYLRGDTGDAGVTNATWGEADSQVAGPSQFWVAGRTVPEPNQDALRIAPVFRYLPQQFKDSTWTTEETKCLTEALLKAAQACLHGSLYLQHRIKAGQNCA